MVEGDEVAEEAAADIAEEAVDLETTQAMDSMRKQIKLQGSSPSPWMKAQS